MRFRFVLILALIVIAPLATLAWLGARYAQAERNSTEHRFQQLAEVQLRDVADTVDNVLASRAREMQKLPALSGLGADAIRRYARRIPQVKQLFVLDEDESLRFPDPAKELSRQEREFLARTEDFFARGELGAAARIRSEAHSGDAPNSGWATWYWGQGVQIIYWWRDDAGLLVGAELNRARLIADVIAALPDSAKGGEASAGFALMDSTGASLYRWGTYVPPEDLTPLATVPLNAPLSAWTLHYYVPGAAIAGRAQMLPLATGLGGLALALIGLALFVYRERMREHRDAQQRITFVNQVSHELKTPLTNIRMYADLLDRELEHAENKQEQKYLRVITSESQRLSRLIGNVLTFGRSRREALQLHRMDAVPDEIIDGVLENFRPAFTRAGISIEFKRGASKTVRFDSDVLEQILGNLLSNVEKYAKGAEHVWIESGQDTKTVWFTVTDDGPGIPEPERRRVFDAFYRVSNRLTDGVAGTGIGLAICRELARLHGGDVVLEPKSASAAFRVTVATQSTDTSS